MFWKSPKSVFELLGVSPIEYAEAKRDWEEANIRRIVNEELDRRIGGQLTIADLVKANQQFGPLDHTIIERQLKEEDRA